LRGALNQLGEFLLGCKDPNGHRDLPSIIQIIYPD